MSPVYDLSHLIDMMVIGSWVMAIMLIIWQFVYNSFKEEINAGPYRKVAATLR